MSSQLNVEISRFRSLRLPYVRRYPLKLAPFLLLAGCGLAFEDCPLDQPGFAVSRNLQEILPTGCEAVEPGPSVTRLACADRRVGYAFPPSTTLQLESAD